jgi:hypothetical protein
MASPQFEPWPQLADHNLSQARQSRPKQV